MKPLRILFVTPEATPIVKVGGLGDVAGALPKALRALGHDVRLFMPLYHTIDQMKYPSRPQWSNLSVGWEGGTASVNINVGTLPNSDTPIYYLDYPEQYAYGGAYLEQMGVQGIGKSIKHFVFFCTAILDVLNHLDWQPDVIHCQDWPSGLLPILLQIRRPSNRPRTVLTIHNMENQGAWSAEEVFRWLGLSGREHPLLAKRDRGGNFNLLQQAILGADTVNTVSPSYAQELLTPEYGCGLEDDLQSRPAVHGILNGIDQDFFNPAHDAVITERYSVATLTGGKQKNKLALQTQLGFEQDAATPLFAAVSRLTRQKGLDLLPPIIDRCASQGWQIAVLGSGMPDIETALRSASASYPETLKVINRFDAALAQQMYAGADFFLMPSRFEPCGLGQMIAMRYGTIPVVRGIGGLKDSVVDLGSGTGHGSGFVFERAEKESLFTAMERAATLFHRPSALHRVRQQNMRHDWSWSQSAKQYEQLYATTTANP